MRLHTKERHIIKRMQRLELRMTLEDVLMAHSNARATAIQREKSLNQTTSTRLARMLKHRKGAKVQASPQTNLNKQASSIDLIRKGKDSGLFPRIVRLTIPLAEVVFLFVMLGKYLEPEPWYLASFQSYGDTLSFGVGQVDSRLKLRSLPINRKLKTTSLSWNCEVTPLEPCIATHL